MIVITVLLCRGDVVSEPIAGCANERIQHYQGRFLPTFTEVETRNLFTRFEVMFAEDQFCVDK